MMQTTNLLYINITKFKKYFWGFYKVATQSDYIKAAQEKGLSEQYVVQSSRNIEQLEKEGNYVNWQWYITYLPEPFDE